MQPGALAEELAKRMTSDLRRRFPRAEAVVRRDDKGELVCEVADDGISWGFVGMPVELDDDEDIAAAHAEWLVVQVFENVFGNLWPDELTDAWPPCPVHVGEPLRPKVVRGLASWTCTRDDAVAIMLGAL